MSKVLAEKNEIEGKVRTNLFVKNAPIAKLHSTEVQTSAAAINKFY